MPILDLSLVKICEARLCLLSQNQIKVQVIYYSQRGKVGYVIKRFTLKSNKRQKFKFEYMCSVSTLFSIELSGIVTN